MPGGFIWRWNEVDSMYQQWWSVVNNEHLENYISNQSQNIADAKKVYSHDACCPILLPERFLSEENMCSAVLSKLLRLQLFAAAATKISEGQKTTERNFFDLTKAGPAFKTFILCYSIPVLELITLFFFQGRPLLEAGKVHHTATFRNCDMMLPCWRARSCQGCPSKQNWQDDCQVQVQKPSSSACASRLYDCWQKLMQ